MKGIYNIGNSCYLNSALQMLFNSDDFKEILKHKVFINTIFENIIDNYNSKNINIFNASEIKALVAKNNNMFNNTNQQDSYEFMIYLFDVLDKMLGNNNNNSKNIMNILYNKFGISTTYNIKCKILNCNKESETTSTELFLQLPMTDDLSDSYRKYKSMEKLENDNAYNCDKCKRLSTARRNTITSKWPDNLIIVLKRFDHNMRKDNRKINIPLVWRHGYKLKGGIIHLGQYGGGHYIYYGEENNNWYIANDTNISSISNINDFMSSNGATSYILKFHRNIIN
jgi:ubiquitin carboxyl-terminal hydrolase 36/42